MQINVAADTRAIERDLVKVHRKLVPKAASQGLNKANKFVRGALIKALATKYQIKPQKRLKRRIFIPKRRGFVARPSDLRAGGLFLMVHLPEIWTLGKSKKAQGAALGPNKFVATTKKGHRGLFRRSEGGRLPITEYMLDVSSDAARLADTLIETQGADRWRREFIAALRNQLRRVR